MLGLAGDALGMADIEMAVFRQQTGKTRPDLRLRRFVEIDNDIETEDDVEGAVERALPHKVQLVEGDQALDAIIDLEFSAPLDSDLLKPLLAHGGRNRFERSLIVGTRARKAQDLRIDIGR